MPDVDQQIREGLARLTGRGTMDHARVFQDLVVRRRRRHRRRVVARVIPVVVLAGILIVGISALDLVEDTQSDVATSDTSEPADAPEDDAASLVIAAQPLEITQLARVSGHLERDGDCLFVRDERANRYAALWPAGTSWQSDPKSERGGSVVTSDGTILRVGERFEAAGSWLGTDMLGSRLVNEDARRTLSACAAASDGQIVFPQGEFRSGR